MQNPERISTKRVVFLVDLRSPAQFVSQEFWPRKAAPEIHLPRGKDVQGIIAKLPEGCSPYVVIVNEYLGSSSRGSSFRGGGHCACSAVVTDVKHVDCTLTQSLSLALNWLWQFLRTPCVECLQDCTILYVHTMHSHACVTNMVMASTSLNNVCCCS